MTDRSSTSDHAAWAAIAVLALAVAMVEWHSPLAIAADSLGALATACGTLGGVAFFYRFVRANDRFATMCIALCHILLFSALGATLSYLLTRHAGALWDDSFAQWDRALGLDWLGFVKLVDAHRWAAQPLHHAYASLIPQFVVLIVVLGFRNCLAELRAIVLAGIVCGTITVLLSPVFPAVSSYVHLGLTPADFHNVDIGPGYSQLADFNALRDGSITILRLDRLQGIIAFPSYHAGLSMVMLWGFWISRVAWLRWPGILLASLTIVATPVDGGHYFVDVLAGLAIAAVSIAFSVRAVRWAPTRPRLTASPFPRSHAVSGR